MKPTNYLLNLDELINRKTYLKSKPLFMQVFIVEQCGLHCIMCKNANNKSKKILSFDKIKKLLLDNQQLLAVEWLGGEPTLHPDFERILDLTNSLHINQIIITNGIFLEKRIIKKLILYNVNVTVSIDSPYKVLYEHIRIGSDFNKLISNLKYLIKEKRNYGMNLLNINYVVLRQNYKYMEKMLYFICKLGIKNIFFKKEIIDEYEVDNFSTNEKSELNKIIKRIQNNKNKYNLNICIDEDLSNYSKKQCLSDKMSYMRCLIPWVSICVFVNGDVKISFFCKNIIGNINKNNLINIWNSLKAIELRKLVIKNSKLNICENCNKLHPITKMHRVLDRFFRSLFNNN